MGKRSYSTRTKDRLKILSMNCCAHPECTATLLSEGGALVADICHIEAINPGGPRYNDDPAITDNERNDYPNLILLCKNHHSIIDQKDEGGNPYYSTKQLKAMKQAHLDRVAAARESLFQKNGRSLLGKIIKQLSAYKTSKQPAKRPFTFKIEEKITYNAIERNYGIIEKYSAYKGIIDKLYNELETGQLETVLHKINDFYITNRRINQTADDTLDRVQSALIDYLNTECLFEFSEELEWCAKIIMVDAFMRCKILEEPPQ